jgi:hypothetical protein
VTDANSNIMPAGTTISFTATNGTITGPTDFTVTNAAPDLGAAIKYSTTMISDATQGSGPGYICTNAVTSGYLHVTVTSKPSDVKSYGDITVND